MIQARSAARPGAVGGQRVERLHRRPELTGDLTGELAEDVVLAGEVLVDRDPGAARDLGDAVERGPVVALLGEDLQRGVEDALLRAQASGTDRGVVRERCPPDRVRAGIS